MRRPSVSALTLVELLTSVTLCLIITTIATGSFLKVQSILKREASRLEMHNDARFIYQELREQLSALQQDAALYVETRSTAQVPAGSDSLPQPPGVDLIFLKGKVDERDFTNTIGMGAYVNEEVDLIWTIWRYDNSLHTLGNGIGNGPRDWQLNVAWVGPKGDYGSHRFKNMPQPRRVAGVNAAVNLNDNRYNTGDTRDVGDYDDVVGTLSRVTRNMSNFTLELVNDDGSKVVADSSSTAELAYDGDYVDGHTGPGTSNPNKHRPQIIRIRFDLTDPVLKFSQTFSFSFQLPGFLPSIYPDP